MASTCNGLPVVEAHVHLPLSGVWTAEVLVDAPAVNPVVGPVALALCDGALTLAGTTMRAGMWQGRAYARVVGGAHGFPKAVTPRSYRSVPVRTVLTDILTAVGEKLSPTADPVILGRVLPAWTRAGDTAALALVTLVNSQAATWRMLLDGSIWVGLDAWPPAGQQDYVVVDARPAEGLLVLGTAVPTLLPGTVLMGQRVERVAHHITGESTRTEAWFA